MIEQNSNQSRRSPGILGIVLRGSTYPATIPAPMAALVYFSVSIPSSGPSGVRSKFCRCLFILSNPEPNVVKAVVYAKSNQENAGYRHEYERKTCGGGQTRQDRTHRISKSLGT